MFLYYKDANVHISLSHPSKVFICSCFRQSFESAGHPQLVRVSRPEWINSHTHADSILFLQEEGIPPT